jgi:hypothetical protein
VDIGPAGGPRRQVTRGGFDTKREALEELGRLQESVRTSTYVEPPKRLLADYLQGWLNGLPATGLEQSTVGAYRTLIEVHAIPELGDTPLQSLDPMMLDRLYAKMLREGRRDGRGGLSPRHSHRVAKGTGGCGPQGSADSQSSRSGDTSFDESGQTARDEVLDT